MTNIFDQRQSDAIFDRGSGRSALRGFAGVFHLSTACTDGALVTTRDSRNLGPSTVSPPQTSGSHRFELWPGPSSTVINSSDGNRTLIVTGSGRIHDPRALKDIVEAGTDPAVLLASQGGMGCALARYDARDGTLLLGRDLVGIMPLYLSCRGDRIVFATELGAFVSMLGVAPEINIDALAKYLDHGFSGRHQTALNGVERVMPGELIIIGRDQPVTRLQKTAVISADPDTVARTGGADADFDSHFRPALDALFDPDRPNSLLLSGGLDSAAICAMLHDTSTQPIHTLAVAYDFTQARDELADARRIADLFKTRHTELRLSSEALWRHIPYMVWRTDELMDDAAGLPTSLASEHFPRGSAVFTGEGADDVFAGDGRYRRRVIQRWASSFVAPGSGGWRTHGLWSQRQRKAIFGESLLKASDDNREDFIQAWSATSKERTWLQRTQTIELATVLPNTLAIKVGRNLDDTQTPVRMPFLDPAVIRFGLSLEDRQKVRGRVGKAFLRQWAMSRLPRDHVNKRKRGFHMPIARVLSGNVLDQLEPALLASTVVTSWFQPAAVVTLFAAYRATGQHADALWRLLHLAIWHTLFIQRPGRAPERSEDPIAWIG